MRDPVAVIVERAAQLGHRPERVVARVVGKNKGDLMVRVRLRLSNKRRNSTRSDHLTPWPLRVMPADTRDGLEARRESIRSWNTDAKDGRQPNAGRHALSCNGRILGKRRVLLKPSGSGLREQRV